MCFCFESIIRALCGKNKGHHFSCAYRIFYGQFQPGHYLTGHEFQPGCQQWTRRLSMAGKNFTKDPQAVVLFITAYADTEKAVKAIRAGAIDFIPKPWETENCWPPFPRLSVSAKPGPK